MSQDRIESRRAFMKKLSKLAGAAAFAASFVAAIDKEAYAAKTTDSLKLADCSGSRLSCDGSCTNLCGSSCSTCCCGFCAFDCKGTCAVGCHGSCSYTCQSIAKND